MSRDFEFKKFAIHQDRCGMKVGTDGVLVGAWAGGDKDSDKMMKILDVGTGTGLIALMMAQRFPNSHVDAIDIDSDACIQAQENVDDSQFSDQVSIFHQSLQQFLLNSEKPLDGYDIIVSNPPFFVNSLKNPDKKRSLARHTDTLPFVDLVRGVKKLLKDDGVIDVILPMEVMNHFLEECLIQGLFESKKHYVKTVDRKAPKRVMLELLKTRAQVLDEQTFTMMDSDGNRTEWYVKLTDKFYL